MSKIPRQSEVIKAYIEANGHVVRACKAAGVNRDTFYEWKRTDPNFAQKLMEAEEEVEEIKLNFAMSFLTKELKKEYKGRSNNEYRMKDSDLLSFIKTQIQLTKKGKVMLGMVQPTETTQTDASGGTERLLGELKAILPNPNIPAPRRNIEDLDHFGNPIKKEGENE